MVVDIEQVDTEVAFTQLASTHHFSLRMYPSSFLAVAEMIYNPFHH